MSFEEPKAPIVRIRKKKVKKKSKENDIVHLPVRASRQTRYSSLTTPTNPQTKGRECCRSIFASCFKIPVCRTLCFRCILPKCYDGEGSDDDDAEARDEGYHSQNRRSSEVAAAPSGGAEGGSNEQDVEMTELKTETVTLIPPPRVMVNDYRKDPCSSSSKDISVDKTNDTTSSNVEMNYIEIESVSLSGDLEVSIPEAGTQDRNERPDHGTDVKEILETGYEEPVQAGVLELELSVKLDKKMSNEVKFENVSNIKKDTRNASDYLDFDNAYLSDDESKYYVNEDVLKRPAPSYKDTSPPVEYTKVKVNGEKVPDYANLGADNDKANEHDQVVHSDDVVKDNDLKVDSDTTPPDYINLTSLESQSGHVSEIVADGMVNTQTDYISNLTRQSNPGVTVTLDTDDERNYTDKVALDVKHDSNDESDDDKEHFVNKTDKEKLLITEKIKEELHISESDSESEQLSRDQDVSTDQTKLI